MNCSAVDEQFHQPCPTLLCQSVNSEAFKPGAFPAPILKASNQANLREPTQSRMPKKVHPGPWPVKQLSFIFYKAGGKASKIHADFEIADRVWPAPQSVYGAW